MPPIVKLLLPIVIVAVVVFIGFQIHWLLGVALIAGILGFGIFANRSVIYAQRGNIAFSKGDETKALEWMDKAYRTKHAQPLHMIGYAYLLLKHRKIDQAEQLLQELLDKPLPDQLRIRAKVNLATAYWLQGRQDEAYRLMEELYPEYENTQVYGNLGYFKLLRGTDLEEALKFNLEAYEYNGDDLTILDNLAQNYYFLGRAEEARDIYVKLMEKSPKSADSYYFYALTLRALGRIEEAREQAEIAKGKDLALITPITREDIETLAAELEAKADADVGRAT